MGRRNELSYIFPPRHAGRGYHHNRRCDGTKASTMGELAASLSHEILHPIATARNNAWAGMRFLEMSPPNLDKAKIALGCVVRDADRANDIVGRMRDQIKKAPPRKERFDLNEAIDEVIVMVR